MSLVRLPDIFQHGTEPLGHVVILFHCAMYAMKLLFIDLEDCFKNASPKTEVDPITTSSSNVGSGLDWLAVSSANFSPCYSFYATAFL